MADKIGREPEVETHGRGGAYVARVNDGFPVTHAFRRGFVPATLCDPEPRHAVRLRGPLMVGIPTCPGCRAILAQMGYVDVAVPGYTKKEEQSDDDW